MSRTAIVRFTRTSLLAAAFVSVPSWADGGGISVVDLAGGMPASPSSYHRQAVSSTGRFVAFTSDASSIVPGIAGGPYRVYVRDMELGVTELVSRHANGAVPMVGSALCASISADGRFVAFTCSEPLTPNAPGGFVESAYLFDRSSMSLELISVSTQGTGGRGSWSETLRGPVVSADGRYVVFESLDPLSDDAGTSLTIPRVYRRDRVAQQTLLISHVVPQLGSNYPASATGGISADGTSVLYQLLGDSGTTPIPTLGIYVRDLATWNVVRVDVDYSSTPLIGLLGATLDWSIDGSRIVVVSIGANPTIGDPENHSDIYIIDWKVPAVFVASLSQSGQDSQSNCSAATISDDGRYLAFDSSGSDFVPWNQSSKRNVILRDLITQRNLIINLAANGTQSNDQHVVDPVISGDGSSVVFVSSSQILVPGSSGIHYFHRNRLGFTHLGYGKPGSGHAAPQLNGSGSTAPGDSGTLFLTNGTPFAPSLLLVSLDRSYISHANGPFKGTVLVTAAPTLVIPLPVDAFGQFFVPYTLPTNLPLPPEVYLQCAMPDPVAVNGVAVSSALLMGM